MRSDAERLDWLAQRPREVAYLADAMQGVETGHAEKIRWMIDLQIRTADAIDAMRKAEAPHA